MSFFSDPGTLEAVKWLLVVFLIAFTMRPYLNIKHLKLWDNGFGLSFGLGTALTFLGAWFISACHLCPFDTPIAYISLAVLALVPLAYCKIKGKKYDYWNKDTIRQFLFGFAVFTVIYFLAIWVVGYNPLMDETTENFMDYGFVENMYRYKQVPPEDIWFADTTLNYYYLGQAATVFLCRLAFTLPEYAYNLMICTILAGLFLMVSELAYAIIVACSPAEESARKRLPAIIGSTVAALSACFAGNGYWVWKGVILSTIDRIKGNEVTDFFFAFAVSFIEPANGALDNGRTEFPSYSIILGDLHAHLVNVLFVLPLLVILLEYASSKEKKERILHLVLISILLGLYKGTNFWDFAIYIVVVFGTVGICTIMWDGFKLRTIIELLLSWIGIYLISFFATLPFTLQFDKISSQICLATTHTPIKMLLIIWVVPFVITLAFGIWVFFAKNLNMTATLKLSLAYLALCALGLIMSPEVVYIKDIYGGDYTRFNTMFKLTYQAYIMTSVFIGIALAVLIMKVRKHIYLSVAIAFVGIFTICNLAYTPDALKDRYFVKDYEGNYNRIGLSTAEGLLKSNEYIFDKTAADMIKEDTEDDLRILEGAGKSYSHADAVSCLSGVPTVLGWETHEWLWKDSYDVVYERQQEIQKFYECGDPTYCQEYIDRYGIDYILVESPEFNLYSVNTAGFESLGDVILHMETDQGMYLLIKVH